MTTQTIETAVKEQIAGAGGTIQRTVIDELAKTEVARRAAALLKAVTEVRDKNKELQKLRADHKILDGDGKVMTEGFTPDTFDKRKKINERIAKIEKAIVKATEQDDFGDIFNLG